MHRLLIFAAVLGLGVIVADAQLPSDQSSESQEVKAVVEQFSKLDEAGTWLGPEKWDERQDFLRTDWPWSRPDSISVIKSYQIGRMKREVGYDGKAFYIVYLDYAVWGQIDSFLNFTEARDRQGHGPTAGQPMLLERITQLFFVDTSTQMGPPETQKVVKGTLRWKMNSAGETQNVGVDAAIRWVLEIRDKSTDPAIKYNGEKTLAILRSLSAGAPLLAQPAGNPKESAALVAKQFVELESSSTPDRWNKVATFFVEDAKPQWDKLQIVDIVGTDVDTNRDSTRAIVYTNALGHLDSALRLLKYPSWRLGPVNSSACNGQDIFLFHFVLSEKYWETTANGTAKELDGPRAWRVEDTSYEPFITLDTAIRYVTEKRDKTADPVIKKNANRTLTILKYYKKGKPLPDELSSGAGGSCG
jgi:hypothetical protein